MTGPTASREPSAAAIAALVDRLTSDPAVLEKAADAARDRGRLVRRLPRDEVLRHIDAVIDVVRASTTGDDELAERAYAAADDLAVDRVEQGISLVTLLDGVASARTVMLEALLDAGRELLDAEQLLGVIPLLDVVVSRIHDRMVIAYRDAEQRNARTTRSRRADALRQLLDGEGAEWAAEAGLDPDEPQHVLVADVAVPAQARALERSLESARGVSALLHGVLCVVRPDLPAMPPGVLVVHGPAVPVGELAECYVHCRQALALHRRGGETGAHAMLDDAPAVALSGTPWLARALSRMLLAKFDPADERAVAQCETAHAQLEVGGGLEDTAERLHVHPNTVKYRLRQFDQRLPVGHRYLRGGGLAGQLRLWWALDTWLAEAGSARPSAVDKNPD